MVRYSISLFLIIIALLAGCAASDTSQHNAAEQEEALWLSTQPVQCLQNPWEEEWMSNHPEETYPKGTPRTLEEAEKTIIKKYFEALGLTIYDVKGVPFPEGTMVCEACHCPDGYTLFLQVAAADATVLRTEFGFKYQAPEDLE